jgi:hypothetical protein
MKNISTGFGLALLAGAIVTHTLVTNLASSANASAVTTAASAVSTAATAQSGPTIVWYQAFARNISSSELRRSDGFWVVRAWSDGKIEGRWVYAGGTNPNAGAAGDATLLSWCGGTTSTPPAPCIGPWVVISDPAQGLTYRSDINFDAKVDGADLGQLLADWGDAPRQDIPSSDCPLALINP